MTNKDNPSEWRNEQHVEVEGDITEITSAETCGRDWTSYQKDEEWLSYSGPNKLPAEDFGNNWIENSDNKIIDKEKIPDLIIVWRWS